MLTAVIIAGTSCGSNGLKCASGVCTSRDAQCASSGSSLGLNRACPASQVSLAWLVVGWS